ncbi:hypothetical protein M404DRAFT_700765 [Pisolithus tinctorius Marx 270]|uniref:Uncharacterized protein n=1 Tax=Pisolithus tinctorius Marx 270 TaxID=870435 RepID=A0A0C3JUU9_PISTI|nr:hypothetical protein M404DRAFT_700765 [Pisolithus tinctorius Marx 270]
MYGFLLRLIVHIPINLRVYPASSILIALHTLCHLLTCRDVVKSIMYRISSIKLCNDDVQYCTVVVPVNLGGSGT